MNHDLKRLEAVAHSHIPEILLLSSLRLERVEDAGGGEQHSESHGPSLQRAAAKNAKVTVNGRGTEADDTQLTPAEIRDKLR